MNSASEVSRSRILDRLPLLDYIVRCHVLLTTKEFESSGLLSDSSF